MPPYIWTRAKVGEHWYNAAYPDVVVSSFSRSPRTLTEPPSGYAAWLRGELLGEFASRELAQRAVEMYFA